MQQPRIKTTLLVLLIWCAGLGAAAQFSKVSLIYPQLEQLYGGQGNPWLGFLVSLISFLGIIFGLTAGLIVARIGMRRMLIAGLVLGAGVSLIQSTLPPLGLMLLSRLIEGASHLVIVVAAPTLIAQITASRFLPLAMTLWSTFFGVAYAFTAWFGAPLVANYGVASLFQTHASWMALVAALLLAFLPKDARAHGAPVTNILAQHVQIYSNPATAAPALAWLCYTLTFVSLLTVLPPFIPEESRALTVGLMPLGGIATSMTLGVALQRRFSPVSVVILGFSISGGASLALWFSPGNPIICILLFCALGFVQGANFSAIPYLNKSAQDRAHAQGAVAQMGNLGNTIGTPIVLTMIGLMGFGGLVVFALLAYGAGIAVYATFARQRKLD